MATANRDEILSRFISVTRCSSSETARQYLEATRWNEQEAVGIYFDSVVPEEYQSTIPPAESFPSETGRYANPSGYSRLNPSGEHQTEDDDLRKALEESLRVNVPKQETPVIAPKKETPVIAPKKESPVIAPKKESPVIAPKRINPTKSIVSAQINTFDNIRRANDESDDDDDDKGQAFYAGGSESSGQQIIGPAKPKSVEKKVVRIFEEARKQGATEAPSDEARSKQNSSFGGVGYSLGDEQVPSRTHGQPPAANRVEQLPIRFYSNGFTVGDGELRRFDENREFVEYIKRGEVPPELRNRAGNGRQIEVQLEDHHNEEYKHVEPAFKAFTGAGQAVGLPRSNVTPHRSVVAAPVSDAPPDVVRLEQLAEKRLKTSSSSKTTTELRLRLPDMSVPVTIKIDGNRTLADVRRFLVENVPILQSNMFDFLEPPATKIKREDERKKISDAHLANSTLVVRRTA